MAGRSSCHGCICRGFLCLPLDKENSVAILTLTSYNYVFFGLFIVILMQSTNKDNNKGRYTVTVHGGGPIVSTIGPPPCTVTDY